MPQSYFLQHSNPYTLVAGKTPGFGVDRSRGLLMSPDVTLSRVQGQMQKEQPAEDALYQAAPDSAPLPGTPLL